MINSSSDKSHRNSFMILLTSFSNTVHMSKLQEPEHKSYKVEAHMVHTMRGSIKHYMKGSLKRTKSDKR